MRPFRSKELRLLLDERSNAIRNCIDKYTNDEIMGNDLQILCNNVYEQYHIEQVSIGDEDVSSRTVEYKKIQKYLDHVHYFEGGRYIEVDGVVIRFKFPFAGDSILFQCKGSTFTLSPYPEIELYDHSFTIEYRCDIKDSESEGWLDGIMKSISKDVTDLREGLNFVNQDVANYDLQLKSLINGLLAERKKKAELFCRATKLLEVPIARSEYARKVMSVHRRISPIAHSYNNNVNEYTISDSAYLDILSVIKHSGSTLERTPESYVSMGEESLRNVLLVALNGTFCGKANGETFRNKGKTDICIEAEERSAFVAECKLWTGEKDVQSALKQLDGYLTWRDGKVALIYFVRRKDFISVINKIVEALKSVSCIDSISKIDANEINCFMNSESTPGQRKQVRVLLFNLYARGERIA